MSPEPPLDDDPDAGRTLAPAQPAPIRALSSGTRLQEFEIIGLVGHGGFGIVYLAHDHSLQRRVAVKEYLPWTLATRDEETGAVTVKSSEELETFTEGLKGFLSEARLLAQFDHPSLVKVHRFWEANGTAYMAMPFYEGPTLLRALAGRHDRPDEEWLRRLLGPLLDALAVMHAARCFHRDISPDNILLTPAGPLLLDLGAARRAISEATQTFTAILKEGYAPPEQYGTSSAVRQGPWTDIYALCGVVRYAITGVKPESAIDRLLVDHMLPLRQIAAGQYSEPFLRAIDAGMAIKPADRPQDVAQFRALMGSAAQKKAAWYIGPTLLRPSTAPQPALPPTSVPETAVEKKHSAGNMRWTLGALIAVGVLVAGYLYLRQSVPFVPRAPAPARPSIAAGGHRPAGGSPAVTSRHGSVVPSITSSPAASAAAQNPSATHADSVHGSTAAQASATGSSQPHQVTWIPASVGKDFPRAADYYPSSARSRGETGKAVVRACVDTAGRLTEIPAIARSSGFASLDDAALHLAKDGSGHYRPAMEDGHPLTSCFLLTVQFNLD